MLNGIKCIAQRRAAQLLLGLAISALAGCSSGTSGTSDSPSYNNGAKTGGTLAGIAKEGNLSRQDPAATCQAAESAEMPKGDNASDWLQGCEDAMAAGQ
jgi:hypothetical protein